MSASSPPGPGAPGSAPTRALVLEASPVRRAVFLALLPPEQYELRFPLEHQDWSGAFREFAPAVALIWQEDPVRFGPVCARLRAQPGGDKVALLLVSRRRAGIARAQAIESGADGMLLLPAESLQVQQEIAQALQARRDVDAAVAGRIQGGSPAPLPPAGPVPTLDPHRTPPSALLAVTAVATWAEFRQNVARLWETLESTTHYGILGLSPTASPRDITLAFHEAAMSYHPDRFVQMQDRDTRRKIYEVFKRMSKAYSILCDPRLRVPYDQSLAPKPPLPPGPPGPPGAPPEAAPPVVPTRTTMGQKFYEMAQRSIQQGRYRLARHQLAVLLQVEPGNPVATKRQAEVDQMIVRNPDCD